MKHTPGPLEIVEGGVEGLNITARGQIIFTVWPTDLKHKPVDHTTNARRLLALWGACEDISTKALENGVVKDMLYALICCKDELTQLHAVHYERGKLACKDQGPNTCLTRSAIHLAQQAIAKAEEKGD